MWDDEKDLRAALHRVVDVSAPPPATRVEEVIRRGRRRVLITRIGTVASAIVAVVGIGVGAAALGNIGLGADGERLPPAGPAISTSPLPSVPREGWVVHQPIYTTTTKEVPGIGSVPDKSTTCTPITLPVASGREVLPEEKYLPVFLDTLRKSFPGESVQTLSKTWVNVNRGLADVAVYSKDKKTQRTFSLSAGRYGGTLEQAAEYYATANGRSCPPKMHWLHLPNGAIVQATDEGIQSFTPSGRWYRITGYEMELDFRTRSSPDGLRKSTTPLPENVVIDIVTQLAALG
ncbi:hypothetical protein [Allokutzneria oryzae]|uniref:PknH-like extracellular domain-containing protein n=1 Tax=Allokutzneria oryzae TaxID=1378989 RepID=A0ABV6A226_9PSEU